MSKRINLKKSGISCTNLSLPNLIEQNLSSLVKGNLQKLLETLGIDPSYFKKVRESLVEPAYEKIVRVFQEYIAKVLGANDENEQEQTLSGLIKKKANYHEIVKDLVTCLAISDQDNQLEPDAKKIQKYFVRIFNILSMFDVSILESDVFVDLLFSSDQVFDGYVKKYKEKLAQYKGLHCIFSYRKMVRDAFDEIVTNGGGREIFEESFDSLLSLADQKLLQHIQNGFTELYKIFLYRAEGFEYDKNTYDFLIQKGKFLREDYQLLNRRGIVADNSYNTVVENIKKNLQPLARKNKKSDKILSNHDELLSLFFKAIIGEDVSYQTVCSSIENMKPDVWKFSEKEVNFSGGSESEEGCVMDMDNYAKFRRKDLKEQTEAFCNLVYDPSTGKVDVGAIFLGKNKKDMLHEYVKSVYNKGLNNLSLEELYQQAQEQYQNIKDVFGRIIGDPILKEKLQAKGGVLGVLLPFLSDDFFSHGTGKTDKLDTLDINDLFLLAEIYEYCLADGNIPRYSGTTQRILKGFLNYLSANGFDIEMSKDKLGFFVDARMQFNKYGEVNVQKSLETFRSIYQKTNIYTDEDFILSGVDLRKEKGLWLPKSGATDEEIYTYIESWYRYIIKGSDDIPDTYKKMIQETIGKLGISEEARKKRTYPRQLTTAVKFFAYLAGMDPTNEGKSLLRNLLDFAKQGRQELKNLFFDSFSNEAFSGALQGKKIVLSDYERQEDNIFGNFSYVQIGPEKKLARLIEKYFEGSATDLVRFKVAYNDHQSLEDGVISFLKHCYNHPAIVQISMIDNMGNVFERAYKGSGYQDIKFLIKTTTGHVIEAQFGSMQMFDAKDGRGIGVSTLAKEAMSIRYNVKVTKEDMKVFADVKDVLTRVISKEKVEKFGLLLETICEKKVISGDDCYLNGQDFYEINRALQKVPQPTERLENICMKLERIIFEKARKAYLLETVKKWMEN